MTNNEEAVFKQWLAANNIDDSLFSRRHNEWNGVVTYFLRGKTGYHEESFWSVEIWPTDSLHPGETNYMWANTNYRRRGESKYGEGLTDECLGVLKEQIDSGA